MNSFDDLFPIRTPNARPKKTTVYSEILDCVWYAKSGNEGPDSL